MFKINPRFAVLAAILLGLPHSLLAAVKLASPFTSHMVLQRELPVPVWGTAAPDEEVTVEFSGQKPQTKADAAGRWRVELKPLTASAESRTLSVAGSSTPEPIRLEDVLVGEVWLASGQSNMDFTVAKTEKFYFAGVNHEAEEVAAANYPRLRMFSGVWAKSATPLPEVAGEWELCTPESVREFSAVGYFFARRLLQDLDVPVGIVTLTFGASTAQAWIRRETIEADPRLRPVLETFDAQMKAYQPPSEAEIQAWQTAADAAKAAGKKAPRRSKPSPEQDQHNPTVMFNGMIAPVIPYAVRGVIWYQGESITEPKNLFPVWNETLIKDWRKLWGRELPFYFCQLASHGKEASHNGGVREAQAAALALPATGMAVTIDIGDTANVHPKNKQDVGDRLARIALAKNYGRPLEYSGPWLESMTAEGGALRLKFSHAKGGLVAKDGAALQTFEIAGTDGNYVPAEAKIEGDAVLVSNAAVAAPVSARYAWAADPKGCNLVNADGLPAAPFRTDAPKLPTP